MCLWPSKVTKLRETVQMENAIPQHVPARVCVHCKPIVLGHCFPGGCTFENRVQRGQREKGKKNTRQTAKICLFSFLRRHNYWVVYSNTRLNNNNNNNERG